MRGRHSVDGEIAGGDNAHNVSGLARGKQPDSTTGLSVFANIWNGAPPCKDGRQEGNCDSFDSGHSPGAPPRRFNSPVPARLMRRALHLNSGSVALTSLTSHSMDWIHPSLPVRSVSPCQPNIQRIMALPECRLSSVPDGAASRGTSSLVRAAAWIHTGTGRMHKTALTALHTGTYSYIHTVYDSVIRTAGNLGRCTYAPTTITGYPGVAVRPRWPRPLTRRPSISGVIVA